MNDEYNEEEYETRKDEEESEAFFDRQNQETEQASEYWPTTIRKFSDAAVEMSHYNEIPAALSFMTIVGQVVKDFVAIPDGPRIDDSRLHFCWIQTSGTG